MTTDELPALLPAPAFVALQQQVAQHEDQIRELWNRIITLSEMLEDERRH